MKKMRRFITLFLGFILLATGMAPIASASDLNKEYMAVTDQVLRWTNNDYAASNGFIPKGGKVNYIEKVGKNWFKVEHDGNEGYVRRGELTSLENYEDTDKADIHPTSMKEQENFDQLVVTIDANLRTKDEPHYRPITLLERETELTYKGTTANNWFKVDYKGQEGYIYRGDVTSKKNWEDQDKTIHESAMAEKEKIEMLEVLMDVNLRTKDDNQYRPIELLKRGDIVHYQGTTQNNWFKVKDENGQEGYIYRGDLTKYQALEIKEDTDLDQNHPYANVVGDNVVVDLKGYKINTLTIKSNYVTIKSGQVKNILIDEDVEGVTFEQLRDDGEGKHVFTGGGAETDALISLKGDTQLTSPIEINSVNPVHIYSDNLKERQGILGKVVVRTDAPITISTPIKEVEIIQENEQLRFNEDVDKVTASADATIRIDRSVKRPQLEEINDAKVTIIRDGGESDKPTPSEPEDPMPKPEPDPTPEPEEPEDPKPTPKPDPKPDPEPELPDPDPTPDPEPEQPAPEPEPISPPTIVPGQEKQTGTGTLTLQSGSRIIAPYYGDITHWFKYEDKEKLNYSVVSAQTGDGTDVMQDVSIGHYSVGDTKTRIKYSPKEVPADKTITILVKATDSNGKSSENVEITVNVKVKYRIKFDDQEGNTLNDSYKEKNSVTIEMKNSQGETFDANRFGFYHLENGTYSYKIEKEGFKIIEGKIKVNDKIHTEKISFKKLENGE